MIPIDEALQIVLDNVIKTETEAVSLLECSGRILAQDIHADVAMPPFNKSAMDGYACKREDLSKELQVLEVIAAGTSPTKEITSGTASKIMTGAMVPEGADCVFMVEYSECPTESTVKFTGSDTRDNICLRGEDIEIGDSIFAPGIEIQPQHIAMLAAMGASEPIVARQPRVGIISTGSELVSADQKPIDSQIRDSNGYQFYAQVKRVGGKPTYYGIVEDDKEKIRESISKVVAENDIVLISGGSSAGDFDFVPELLKELQFKTLFEKIKIKPGKPTTFAVNDSTVCFGMPGNPVSAFVIFETFVRPYIISAMGGKTLFRTVPALLASPVRRKCNGRSLIVPVAFRDDGKVEAVTCHGSAHIDAMGHSDGMISLPPTFAGELSEGTHVTVRLI